MSRREWSGPASSVFPKVAWISCKSLYHGRTLGTCGAFSGWPCLSRSFSVSGPLQRGRARAPERRHDAPSQSRTATALAFTIAVIPDTQTEVFGSDPRLPGRNQWLIDNRKAMDLRFVAQVGDLTDWGWLAPAQLTKASDAFRKLEDAGIPYSIAVGNHDTRVVGWNGHGGYGGSAYVYNPECLRRFSATECHSPVLIRRTQEINGVFNAGRFGKVAGAFEPGKIDNLYSTFTAGRKTARPRPRDLAAGVRGGLGGARRRPAPVVQRHRQHARLHGLPEPHRRHADNGPTAPRQLWNEFISKHSNIKMVLCGHAGKVGMRVDTGAAGNKVVTFRQTFPKTVLSNPVRLVTIHPVEGSIDTKVYAPRTDYRFSAQTATIKGLDFVG